MQKLRTKYAEVKNDIAVKSATGEDVILHKGDRYTLYDKSKLRWTAVGTDDGTHFRLKITGLDNDDIERIFNVIAET